MYHSAHCLFRSGYISIIYFPLGFRGHSYHPNLSVNRSIYLVYTCVNMGPDIDGDSFHTHGRGMLVPIHTSMPARFRADLQTYWLHVTLERSCENVHQGCLESTG